MTSIPNLTRVGVGKKQTTHTSPMEPSPARQRSLEEVTQRDRANSFKDLQLMLQSMQEVMCKNHEDLKKEIGEVRNDTGELKEKMRSMDGKFECFQQQIMKNEQKLQEMEERMGKEELRVDEMNERLVQANRELELTVISLEVEKAAYYLRIQNIRETKGEDLPVMVTDILARALGTTKEDMASEIDETYRIHTNYARWHNLPREVHIRFVKKSVRDEILFRTRDDPLEYQGRQLIVLKQVPKRVRDMRRPYQQITSKLIRKNINFRWLVPEGIMVTWQEKRFRLDTIDKVEEFYRQNFGSEEELVERQQEKKVRPCHSPQKERNYKRKRRELGVR